MQDWSETAQLQAICLRVHADHPRLQRVTRTFLDPLVIRERQPTELLEFFLHLRLNGDRPLPAPSGPPTELQFVNVACFRAGDTLSFRTKDGSGLDADVATGRASGTLTPDLTLRRHVFADLLLAPLMEMLKRRGYYGLHAAALCRQGTGYLFPANAGQGKTTIGLGLLQRGFQYLADDKVLLQQQDGEIAALAFTRRFNIDPDIADRYQELGFITGLEPLPLTTKRPVDVSEVYPDSFAPRFRPTFIIHLRRTPTSRSRIAPLTPAESFARLVRQTILAFDRPTATRQLQLLGRLAGRAHNYLLDNGNDLYGEPDRLLELLPHP